MFFIVIEHYTLHLRCIKVHTFIHSYITNIHSYNIHVHVGRYTNIALLKLAVLLVAVVVVVLGHEHRVPSMLCVQLNYSLGVSQVVSPVFLLEKYVLPEFSSI